MRTSFDAQLELEFGLLWFYDAGDTVSAPPQLVPPATMAVSDQICVVAAQHMVDGPVRVVVDRGDSEAGFTCRALLGTGVLTLPSGRMAVTGDAALPAEGTLALPPGAYDVRVTGDEAVDPSVLHIQLSGPRAT